VFGESERGGGLERHELERAITERTSMTMVAVASALIALRVWLHC
jgi:hypothetical protein